MNYLSRKDMEWFDEKRYEVQGTRCEVQGAAWARISGYFY